MLALVGLFFAAFIAATILPMQSEVVLVGLLLADIHSVTVLLLVATVGNVLGSVVNWILGRYITQFRDRRWFPANPQELERAEGWYHKYGRWSLLMAWAPFIGDPLTVVAGVLREPFWPFLVLVTISKAGRYLVLTAATLAWV